MTVTVCVASDAQFNNGYLCNAIDIRTTLTQLNINVIVIVNMISRRTVAYIKI